MTFRRVIEDIRTEMKTISGHRPTLKEYLAFRKDTIPPALHEPLEVVAMRGEKGPNVGDDAPDFRLKQLGSEEIVQLSSFRGQRPVGLVFGSYT